jgi:hypothetical protein
VSYCWLPRPFARGQATRKVNKAVTAVEAAPPDFHGFNANFWKMTEEIAHAGWLAWQEFWGRAL